MKGSGRKEIPLTGAMEHHYAKQLVLVLLVGWFALFTVNQLVWAFVSLTLFVLSVGFVISRFVLGVSGWANLTMSTAGCGSGIALIFWLLFRVLA
jgi:hypothetical protein